MGRVGQHLGLDCLDERPVLAVDSHHKVRLGSARHDLEHRLGRAHDAKLGVGEEYLDGGRTGVPDGHQVRVGDLVWFIDRGVQADVDRRSAVLNLASAAQQAIERAFAGRRAGE